MFRMKMLKKMYEYHCSIFLVRTSSFVITALRKAKKTLIKLLFKSTSFQNEKMSENLSDLTGSQEIPWQYGFLKKRRFTVSRTEIDNHR